MRPGTRLHALPAMLFAALAAMPAHAQDASETEIDALIAESATADGAMTVARRQSGEGNLLEAAATLERALINHPRDTALRLYYASVLCRLDDRQRAAIEAAKTGQAGDRTELDATCGPLPKVQDAQVGGGGWRGQFAVGLAYDSDAGGALTDQLDIPGSPYARRDGLAFTGSAGATMRSPIGGMAFAYAGVSALTRNTLSGPSYEYQLLGASGGLGMRSGQAEISGGITATRVWVGGDGFLAERGGQVRAALLFGKGMRVTVRGEIVSQAYRDTPLFSRDGTRYEAALDLTGGSGDRSSYLLGAAYERKDADTDFLGYRGFRAYAGGRFALGKGGAYGTVTGTMRHIDYYNDPMTRDYVEDRYFARGGAGVPVLKGVLAEGAVSWTRRDYNAASLLRDYDSVGGELRLIFTFGN